ncbi:hypothetical protein GGF31_004000 [Allomyces arbusculus]|nr:hypothetical protein GGF31_004000 [Allomyces arbusculus]
MAKIAYNRCSRGLGMLDQDLEYLSEPKPKSPVEAEATPSPTQFKSSPTSSTKRSSFSISRMLFGSSKSKSSR